VLPLTIRHVYDFGRERHLVGGDLVRPEAWDALRTRSDGPFALPADRAAWDAAARSDPDLVARAGAISAWLRAEQVRSLASYGVGTALIDGLVWQADPTRRTVLADYAPGAVERLAAIFPEVRVQAHDLLVDPPLDADVHLFHRVDTELSNAEWRALFRRFSGERILVVATEVAGLRRMSWEVRRRITNRSVSSAGWLRNRAAFDRLWAATHAATPLRMHDLHAWDLTPRQVRP
jgi:hypothetical protein